MNGWIKDELFFNFGLAAAEDIPKLFDGYVSITVIMSGHSGLQKPSSVQGRTGLLKYDVFECLLSLDRCTKKLCRGISYLLRFRTSRTSAHVR